MKQRRLAPWLLLAVLAGGCSRPIEEVVVSDRSLVSSAPQIVVGEHDWPWWRGEHLDGIARGGPPLTSWSETENVLWKTAVPGSGHASPIVCGDHVYVATADPDAQIMSLLCYQRDSGQQLWQRELHRGGFMHKHGKNSHASATPACDGQRVFTVFMVQDALWVSALDRQGQILWQTSAGPFESMHGYGSSPLLHASLVIVAGDNPGAGFLAALHRETGEVVWRVRRTSQASFGTPVIAQVAGRQQLLLSGHKKVISYDPLSGAEQWSAAGPATTTANTIACSEELVFASGGYPEQEIMAIHGDGSGRQVWSLRYKAYVPSPLLVGNRLFVVQDNGVVRCLQADSGEALWTKRLSGGFSASPVLAGEHIYVVNEQGLTYVFRNSDRFEEVAQNQLSGGGFASPVICDGKIYLRTTRFLYCIGS